MKLRSAIIPCAAFVMPFLLAAPSMAEDLTAEFDAKHKECLERIAVDADLAYEEAMIWRGDGGGRRAKHCVAMALYAVGHTEEAAHRLNKLAVAPDGGTKKMRADFYAEAANFWLLGNLPKEAYASATAGLKLRKDHVGLRVARARAYALLGRFDYAEIDLTSALVYAPENVDALRYRADARRNIGNLQDAKDDIDKAISLDYTSFETAVVRGEILEALRAQDAEKTDTDTE